MNAETGDVVDVLVANGLDYRDPELDEMLEACGFPARTCRNWTS